MECNNTVSVNAAAKGLGMSPMTLMKRLLEKQMPVILGNISKELYEQLLRQKNEYTDFDDFLSSFYKTTTGKQINVRLRQKYYMYARGFNFWGARWIQNPVFSNKNTSSRIRASIFVRNDDLDILRRGFKEVFFFSIASDDEKMHYLLSETDLKNYCTTCDVIKRYFNEQHRKDSGPILEATNYLRLNLKKELGKYTDEEIAVLVAEAEKVLTNRGNMILVSVINKYAEINGRKLKTVLNYNRHKFESKESNVYPYDLDTYIKVFYMVINEEYHRSHDMIRKACDSAKMAKTWLYHLMCYLCGWRSADIRERLPRIELVDAPEKTIDKVRNGEYTKEYYKVIAQKVVWLFSYSADKKPNKTKDHRFTPDLRPPIMPESVQEIFGMLSVLCEAHNRLRGINGGLCYTKQIERKDGENLFGEEYAGVLGGKAFSSRRAAKNFMNSIAEKGEKQGVNGYILASFVRSHTSGFGNVSEITARYIKAQMDGYTPNEIVKCLMERGVCSFEPYLLCSMLMKDSFEHKTISEQTQIIKSLSLTPAQVEGMLKIDADLAEQSKKLIKDIVGNADVDSMRELVTDILTNMINGDCTGKTRNSICLSKACYRGCQHKEREKCIGCEFEIYVKSIIMELVGEIDHQISLTKDANNDKLKKMHLALLNDRLYPVVREILHVMKYVFNEDVNDYILMLRKEKQYASLDCNSSRRENRAADSS